MQEHNVKAALDEASEYRQLQSGQIIMDIKFYTYIMYVSMNLKKSLCGTLGNWGVASLIDRRQKVECCL